MATYKTPGVYVREISTLPPSVAEVSTAVPAFIGYTEKGSKNQPTRIATMLDYEALFGGPQPTAFTATVSGAGSVSVTKTAPETKDFLMYYCLRMYFDNGGGPCYVVSVGDYQASAPGQQQILDGLAAVAKEDEPTLILLTDAVNLESGPYHAICVQALAQCGKLKDRFAIFDVLRSDTDGADFRGGIGTDNLKYGAAYFPYLQTLLNHAYDDTGVTVHGVSSESQESGEGVFEKEIDGLKISFKGSTADSPMVSIKGKVDEGIGFAVEDTTLTISTRRGTNDAGVTAKEVFDAWQAKRVASAGFAAGFDVGLLDAEDADVQPTADEGVALVGSPTSDQSSADAATMTLASLKQSETAVYNRIKAELAKQYVVLPPSAAMAGIYAKVDRERGVWKAPANVGVASVIGPTVKITHDEQADLNIDPTAGKSINAIRSFVGKGTLVWGARTLAGNDNEWRYINVRRLFNTIEESTQKATSFAVFEANDATTWLKVKGMIESYLYGLWEQGALAGPTPDSAFFVNVGLGQTMTTQDVLEGRMIVEIGIAAVRPAEFIVLRFSHKLQEA